MIRELLNPEGVNGAPDVVDAEQRGGGAAPQAVPDPELTERPKRRSFGAEQKLAVLKEADACAEPGEVGANL